MFGLSEDDIIDGASIMLQPLLSRPLVLCVAFEVVMSLWAVLINLGVAYVTPEPKQN